MSTILCKSVHVSEGTTQSNVKIFPKGIFKNAEEACGAQKYFEISVTRDECIIKYHVTVDGKWYDYFVYSCKSFIISTRGYQEIEGFSGGSCY